MAIAQSIFSYPSCIYWYSSLSIFIFYIFSFFAYIHFNFVDKVPTLFELMQDDLTKSHFKYLAILSCFLLSMNFYYIQRYYRIMHRNSSSDVKNRLNIYLAVLLISSIVYLTFFALTICLDSNKHPILQALSLIVYFMSQPVFHIIPKGIVRLKHPTRSLYGYLCIHLSTLFTIIGSPFLLYDRISGSSEGAARSIYSYLFTCCYLMNGLSFIFDAVTLLSHRFIRFYMYFPPTKQTVRRPIVVV